MKESLNNLYSNMQGRDPQLSEIVQMGRFITDGLDKRKTHIDFVYHKRTTVNPYYLEEFKYAFSGVASPKYKLFLEINLERMSFILQYYLQAKYPTKEIKATTLLAHRSHLGVLSERISKLIMDGYNTYGYMPIHSPFYIGEFILTAFKNDHESIYLIDDIVDRINSSSLRNIKMTFIERLIQSISNIINIFKMNKGKTP